jgi:drug/metabolite transporter (DMT)-like permease
VTAKSETGFRSHGAAPHAALVTVQILFATWPIVGKLALHSVPSLTLVGFRVVGAALALLAMIRMRGRLQRIKRTDWPLLALSSLLGLIFNQWLYVKGLSLTTAINATLLSTTIPVSTFLVGLVVGTDRASWQRIIGILIAAAGVLYLIGPGRASFSTATRVGDFLIVGNSLCYGAYIAVSKDLVRRYDPLSVITWVFVLGCFATAPVGAISLAHVPLRDVSLTVWLEILYIVLLPTAGAYFLNAWALARVPPSTVAVYIYLQPLIAFVLAPLILGESLSWRTITASLLVFAGVVVVTRGRRRTGIVNSKS